MAIRPEVLQTVFDNSEAVIKAIKVLADKRVMVGIPAKNAGRRGSGPNNALLGYVHEHGMPDRNLPARPFLRPGVQSDRLNTIRRLRQAAEAALQGNEHAAIMEMRAAGQEAASAVQRKITDGPFAPLAPSTLRRRQAKIAGTAGLTATQIKAGFADIKPLIDTGALRASITYVLRNRGGRDI